MAVTQHSNANLCFFVSGGPACFIFFALPRKSPGEPFIELGLFLELLPLLPLKPEAGDLEEDLERDRECDLELERESEE